MMIVKRILRYLKGTKDYGLHYKRSERFDLKVFTGSDWAGNIDDRKKHQWRCILSRKEIGVMDKQEVELHFPIKN